MSQTEIAVVQPKSLAKGLIAGLVGGLVGALAMAIAERIFPPHPHSKAKPGTKEKAADGIHWGFGLAAGAAYGAIAEFYPPATAKDGASFGITLGALTQEGSLAALSVLAKPEAETTRERASELTSYVVYGVATETTRGFLRKRI